MEAPIACRCECSRRGERPSLLRRVVSLASRFCQLASAAPSPHVRDVAGHVGDGLGLARYGGLRPGHGRGTGGATQDCAVGDPCRPRGSRALRAPPRSLCRGPKGSGRPRSPDRPVPECPARERAAPHRAGRDHPGLSVGDARRAGRTRPNGRSRFFGLNTPGAGRPLLTKEPRGIWRPGQIQAGQHGWPPLRFSTRSRVSAGAVSKPRPSREWG